MSYSKGKLGQSESFPAYPLLEEDVLRMPSSFFSSRFFRIVGEDRYACGLEWVVFFLKVYFILVSVSSAHIIYIDV